MSLNFYNKLILLTGILNCIIFLMIVSLYKKNILINFVHLVKIVYKGFDPDNMQGIVKGVVWAFVDGIITGVLIAFIIKIFNE